MTDQIKLHIGCGTTILPGWVNIDIMPDEGVDLVFDLETCKTEKLPYEDNSVSEFRMLHTLEHLDNTLDLMDELYRVAKPDAEMLIAVPYGSSDEAWSDPTHKRPVFLRSFNYFQQPFYTFADYGYSGDWQVYYVGFKIDGKSAEGLTPPELMVKVDKERNFVLEMFVKLRATKPARGRNRSLLTPPDIQFITA